METTIMDWPTLDDAEHVRSQLTEPERELVDALRLDVPAGGVAYERLAADHGQEATDRLLWAGVLRWTHPEWGVRLSELGRLVTNPSPDRDHRLRRALRQLMREAPWRRAEAGRVDRRHERERIAAAAAAEAALPLAEVEDAYTALHPERQRIVTWERGPRSIRGGDAARGDLHEVARKIAGATAHPHVGADYYLHWWMVAIGRAGAAGWAPAEEMPPDPAPVGARVTGVWVTRVDPDGVGAGPEPEPRPVSVLHDHGGVGGDDLDDTPPATPGAAQVA